MEEPNYEYIDPRDGTVAIQTTNKMIGVKVTNMTTGQELMLDSEDHYREITKKVVTEDHSKPKAKK